LTRGQRRSLGIPKLNEGRIVSDGQIVIAPVGGKADVGEFIELAYRLNGSDPNWVPPLRSEVYKLITPGKNPFHEHARMQLFLARRNGKVVGRISAHIDELMVAAPAEIGLGPGTGNWGLLEAEDEATTHALIAAAEEWLRAQDMTRVLAPISLSVWEEPGLLTFGHDHPPAIMMGHDSAQYQAWVESAPGYTVAKRLYTYKTPVKDPFPPLINKIVESGERNPRIELRELDMKRFDEEAQIILAILNDAWSDNWGFVPITDSEIAHISKEMKPLLHGVLNMIAYLDGRPVAFMMALPNVNEPLHKMGGRLFPFGWAHLLWFIHRPRPLTMRVPLMGVIKELQNSRLAMQLAFMMIEFIRRNAVRDYGTSFAEIGWVLEDNKGMVAIADAIGSTMNREYTIYSKSL
jgi:hypothetical protein